MTFIVSTLTFDTGLGDWFNRVFKKMQPYGYTRAAIEMERGGVRWHGLRESNHG
jgi:hypothetical protein